MSADRPPISVIVGSRDARHSIRACLAALLPQCSAAEAEIVLVDSSTDGTDEIVRQEFSQTRLLRRPPATLIPELWADGIAETNGEIVALTTAHCVPAAGWVRAMLEAHRDGAAGVGGTIENEPEARVVDWAIYFCRYSAFMPPLADGFVTEIAGDNASYRRDALDRCRGAWRSGFWEPVVHAELRKEGERLRLTSTAVVRHRRSFEFSGFLKNRFQHGMRFGRDRCRELSAPMRVLRLLLAPAIPLVFLQRIGSRALARPGLRQRFWLSLPVLIAFLVAWSTGEALGYLRGRAA